MDALILSCGTGGGHDSAARAVAEALERRGHTAVILNPYALKSSRLTEGINNTYIAAARSAPGAFGAVYKLGQAYRRLPVRSPVYYVNHGMNGAMEEYLRENRFDVILTTHLFPAEILTNMKRHGAQLPPTLFIATDYVCIPFTEETQCDAYVIPTSDLAEDFASRGLPEEKLHPLGIPVSGRFREPVTKAQARERLGLQGDVREILVSGGSMGGGTVERAVGQLLAHFGGREGTHLCVVCGSNQRLLQRLKAERAPNLTVLGHTDQMALYLKACDLFITKPGGLSSTEAAVRGVPLFHTCPIPGCETYNAQFFSSRGMSLYAPVTPRVLQGEVEALLEDAQRQEAMLACQRANISPTAPEDICALAESMAGGRGK